MLTTDRIRRFFPALQTSKDVLLDNAGGSQVPVQVADAVRNYMLTTYTQVGADYEISRRSTETVERAHAFVELFMNVQGKGKVAFGSSTTVLCAMLADCYANAGAGVRNEIIVAETAHEANAGPWYRLAERGFRVLPWRFEDEDQRLTPESLAALLSDRTRIVAFPHASNLLGRIEDAAAFIRLAHNAGARVVIDAVAYAPHRAMDVSGLRADWYVYSTYKVFGPHMAAMYGSHEAFADVDGPNHFFIPHDAVPYKFEPGGPSHEGCAGILALWPYLAAMAGADPDRLPYRRAIDAAYAHITDLEAALLERVVAFLRTKPAVRFVGPASTGKERVSTISFVHRSRRSEEVAKAANAQGLGIRYGHFYAFRLCKALVETGVLHDVEDGVVRISMLHYNSMEEVDRLIECLDRLL
ncbi:MAG: aminotransferase class V-fold PLP-dependent enzyme [Phycisphaerae bacterium]|nr:aminotransferase class V-fold PLP-dependent enzyme [Phycisphaerae bacterium]